MTERPAQQVILCLAFLSAFFGFWVSLALERISVTAVLLIPVILLTFVSTGLAVFRTLSSSKPCEASFSIIFVTGGLLVSVFLYIFRVLSPFGIIPGFLAIVLLLISSGVYGLSRNRHLFSQILPKKNPPEIFAIAIMCLATTFWCQDLLHPFIEGPDGITLRAWPDVFYHLSQISMFSISDVDIPLSDVQFILSDLGLYHYGSYTVASSFVALTGSSPISAYAGIYVPLALLFAYSAAFGIIHEFFGAWPAFLSTAILATLPDPSFYGLSNPFFGYNWLQQIAPSGAYGVACACVALYFVLKGITENKFNTVLVGGLFVLLTVLFKAQIFVPLAISSTFITLAFFGNFKNIPRIAALVLAAIAMFVTTEISQKSTSIPTLRLDGSSLEWYRKVLLSFTPEGHLKNAFSSIMGETTASYFRQYVTFAIFVFFSTLGIFGVTLLAAFFVPAATSDRSVKFAPVFVVLVYLIMASGLALEENNVGTPEEFLHRHFVWAYFVASIFSAAVISQFIFGKALFNHIWLKPAVLGIGFLSLWWPLTLSSNIQSAPYLSAPHPTILACELDAAQFIANNSRTTDIFHDTAYNIGFHWSGLTGLRAYITDSGGYRMPSGAHVALDTVKTLESTSSQELLTYLRSQGVDWLISKTNVEGVASKAFQCGNIFVSKL